jgi:hypothetical protein
MSLTNSSLWFSSGVGGGSFYGYSIDDSLRFEDGSNAYLSRTPASAGNLTTFTYSVWLKRGNISISPRVIFFHAWPGSAERASMRFELDNLYLEFEPTNINGFKTNALFRDPLAWYHIVVVWDSTNATQTDRVRLYVNGERVTDFSQANYPALNAPSVFNSVTQHEISSRDNLAEWFDGYMAEINFIDGQALDPTSFGEDKNGTWIPKEYSGSYGTNGFYLDFSDNSTATALGTDSSGNSNNFSVNNITTTDQMLDTPTNNFAVLNSTSYGKDGAGGAPVFTEGNLRIYESTSSWSSSLSTIAVSSGKWYAEAVIVTGTNSLVGVMEVDETSLFYSTNSMYMGRLANSYGYIHSGTVYNNNISSAYGATYTTGDVIGIALDMDAGTLTFYKNGVSQGTAATGLTGRVAFGLSSNLSTLAANFGQDSTFAGNTTAGGNTDANGIGDFKYSVPSGFLALCTANLPDTAIGPDVNTSDTRANENFIPYLYTADNTSPKSRTGMGFTPDWLWFKDRTTGFSNGLYDTVRGIPFQLQTNNTSAENSYTLLDSFDSDGFTTTSDGTAGNVLNYTTDNYVTWSWKAGGAPTATNSAGVGAVPTSGSVLIDGVASTATLAGTIAANKISANTTAGFSIVSYTGNGTSGATIGHGLDSAPEMVITKNRDATQFWIVQHKDLSAVTYNLYLQGTDAQQADGQYQAISNTTLTVSGASVNTSGNDYISYCFHSVGGFSKVGSYTGNGSTNGPFVYTGFRPAFVLLKKSSAAGDNWSIYDTGRDPYNVATKYLIPNSSQTEGSTTSLDFVSNGFKIRASGSWINTSSATYIYLAFAENPFKYANAR